MRLKLSAGLLGAVIAVVVMLLLSQLMPIEAHSCQVTAAHALTPFRSLQEQVTPSGHDYRGYPYWRGRTLTEVLRAIARNYSGGSA
jgi:hypothetical protein